MFSKIACPAYPDAYTVSVFFARILLITGSLPRIEIVVFAQAYREPTLHQF